MVNQYYYKEGYLPHWPVDQDMDRSNENFLSTFGNIDHAHIYHEENTISLGQGRFFIKSEGKHKTE